MKHSEGSSKGRAIRFGQRPWQCLTRRRSNANASVGLTNRHFPKRHFEAEYHQEGELKISFARPLSRDSLSRGRSLRVSSRPVVFLVCGMRGPGRWTGIGTAAAGGKNIGISSSAIVASMFPTNKHPVASFRFKNSLSHNSPGCIRGELLTMLRVTAS